MDIERSVSNQLALFTEMEETVKDTNSQSAADSDGCFVCIQIYHSDQVMSTVYPADK